MNYDGRENCLIICFISKQSLYLHKLKKILQRENIQQIIFSSLSVPWNKKTPNTLLLVVKIDAHILWVE